MAAEGKDKMFTNYRTLMLSIFEDLVKDDLDKMKYCLKDQNVGQGELEKAESGTQILNIMEKYGILSERKLSKLSQLLQEIGRHDLQTTVQKFLERKSERAVKQRKQSMFVVPFFQETHNSKHLQKKMDSSNVAVLVGPPATGKTQLAFWYARKFSEEHGEAVVWKFRCQQFNHLMTSMADLLDDLDIETPESTEDKKEWLYYMGELIRNYLQNGPRRRSFHLLIFDEVNHSCSNIVARMIEVLKQNKKIKIIATTNETTFYHDFDSSSCLEIDGLSETECLEFFRKSQGFEDKDEEIKKLGQMVGYLPLALAIARSYITEAKVSIDKYIQSLTDVKFLQIDKTFVERSEYKKGLVDSHIFVLTEMQGNLDTNQKFLLQCLPFLDNDKVSVSTLMQILPNDVPGSDRFHIVVHFLNALRQYSLITDLGGKDDSRVVSFHAVTGLAMSVLSKTEEKAVTLRELLCFLSRSIDMDARLRTASNKNMKNLSHAKRVIDKAQDMFFDSQQSEVGPEHLEISTLLSYVCCAVGVTYRVNGLEEYFADLYLNMARKCLLKCIGLCSYDASLEKLNDEIQGYNSYNFLWRFIMYWTNKLPLHRMADRLFKALKQGGDSLSDDFLWNFILSKVRNSRDIEHMRLIGNFEQDSFQGDSLTKTIYEKLCEHGNAVPIPVLKKYFLLELMLIILYNNGRNLCDMKYSLEGERKAEIMEKGCFEFKLALALNEMLQTESKFLPVQSIVLMRNGYHFLLLSDVPPDEPVQARRNRLHKGIVQHKKLLKEDVLSKIYFEFGVPKMSSKFDQHHRGMCMKLLLKCFLELHRAESDTSLKGQLFQEGIVYAESLESLTNDLREWVALPGFFVQIAKFYSLNPTSNLIKAEENFKKALTLEMEENEDMSHFSLQANYGLLNCYLASGEPQDLQRAAELCRDLIDSLETKNREQFLCKIRKILAKIQTKQTE